jgi:hypothetical protein
MVLRCTDPETAEYMSKYLGDAQVVRSSEGKSSSDSGASHSWNEQSANQRVVMASEIQQLPNLKGFLKIAGQYPVCAITLGIPEQFDKATEPFILRDFSKNPMIQIQPSTVEAPPAVEVPAITRKILIRRGGQ